MPTIVPDVDVYGKFARVSALADYLELLALNETQLSKELVADLIQENDWTLEEPITLAGAEPPATDEEPLEAADRVFTMVQEREDLLGEKYPFEIWHNRVRLKPGVAIANSPYVALLAITLTHAYRIAATVIPYQTFEETVARIAASKGLLTANVGSIARHAASFDVALEAAADAVRLRALRAAAPTYTYAQDERIDTLCNLEWGDTRPGAWTMLGQATCAKSEAWDKKICEPPAPNWAKLLGVGLKPQVFLAVPHHVGRAMLEKLVSDREHLVLDRPRLVRYKDAVLPDESVLISALLECEVEGAAS